MRLLLRLCGLGVFVSAVAVACGGPEFSSDGNQGGTGSGATGAVGATGGSGAVAAAGGTAGGGTTLCDDPKDCDDTDPCTTDVCLGTGVCDHDALCGGAQPFCCGNGKCSECCSAADCNDHIDCTDDTCFAGVCNFLPGDSCGSGAYCSTNPVDGPSGCVMVEDCEVDADCDHGDPCTKDACVDHKCTHPVCPQGGTCCPGLGCGSCCGDSQCPSDDPCRPSTCGADLKCATQPLCADGDLCCKSADGNTAACGECCEAGNCPDDGVACTEPKCKSDPNGFNVCSQEPNPDRCPVGQTCDARSGCSSNECKTAADCATPTTCQQVSCNGGQCVYGNVGCSHGQECCAATGACQDCCSNQECTEAGMNRCCPSTGICAECCVDSDCNGYWNGGWSGSGGRGSYSGGVGGGDAVCPVYVCSAGQCVDKSQSCSGLQQCCAGVGCVAAGGTICPVLQ
jgi:hypothetical protein